MKKIFLLLGMVMLLVACGGNKTKVIQMKGSDTILNLGQAVGENYMKKMGTRVAVTGGGSGTGIAALFNGTTDIAQASRPIKQKEIKKAEEMGMKIKKYTVAFDGITVIINKENKITNLTTEQLRAIYMGEITNWDELGNEKGKIVVLSRDSSSGTHVFFKDEILRRGKKTKEEYTKSALFLPSNQVIVDEVKKNKLAIGYIGMGYMNDSVKAIAVNGIEATVENVSNKTYPIARGLYWYIDEKSNEKLKDIIDYMFTEEGQNLVKKEGFVSVN